MPSNWWHVNWWQRVDSGGGSTTVYAESFEVTLEDGALSVTLGDITLNATVCCLC